MSSDLKDRKWFFDDEMVNASPFGMWIDDNGMALVCPHCNAADEFSPVELQWTTKEDYEIYGNGNYDALLVPHQGPGGYSEHTNEVPANWKEVGVFMCGNCGTLATPEMCHHQLINEYVTGSREYVADTSNWTANDGRVWSDWRHYFGYSKK